MQQLDELIAKWEKRLVMEQAMLHRAHKEYDEEGEIQLHYTIATLKECISDAKYFAAKSSTRYLPTTLDSMCRFPKHEGKPWKQVIEQDTQYASWCMTKMGLQFDEAAHNFLCEMENKQQ